MKEMRRLRLRFPKYPATCGRGLSNMIISTLHQFIYLFIYLYLDIIFLLSCSSRNVKCKIIDLLLLFVCLFDEGLALEISINLMSINILYQPLLIKPQN